MEVVNCNCIKGGSLKDNSNRSASNLPIPTGLLWSTFLSDPVLATTATKPSFSATRDDPCFYGPHDSVTIPLFEGIVTGSLVISFPRLQGEVEISGSQ